MKTQLSKEVFDFLKSIGGIVNSFDGKTYIYLPHVFEVVSEGYNIVIEHYNDKKLPDDVKEALIENAICKPKVTNLKEELIAFHLRNTRCSEGSAEMIVNAYLALRK